MLTHFKALQFVTSQLPSMYFSTIANGTHIIGPTMTIPFTYEYLKAQFHVIGVFVQHKKNVA